ncbi:hypothetical protein GK091_09615 [Spirosoma agri]|uniref:Uncharacterized protein n=1 Tax=Spirosoma agri TaxID=1987381 RepID=A0A6M0IHG7_9BACT|nr:hypothetical protein [Spirosoma agri]
MTSLFGLFTLNTILAQTNPISREIAKPGQKVWVICYHVKSDKRAQYERFVHQLFWAGASKLTAEKDKQVFRQTRVLHPTKASPDGSYTYLFIMDPYIDGADYDIESLLRKMYGAKQASEYFKQFSTALMPKLGYEEYLVTQSKD